MTRRELDFGNLGASKPAAPAEPDPLDLSIFHPRGAGKGISPLEDVQEIDKRAIDKASQFPSRDPSTEQQINIRAPDKVLLRFRMLCRAERRTYADMLSRMMDAYGDPKS